MMDRVVKMTETGGNFDKGYVEAELDINPDLWFFGCHFIGDPVMPGCLGLDAMWQLVGFYLGWLGGEGKGRALLHPVLSQCAQVFEAFIVSRKATGPQHAKQRQGGQRAKSSPQQPGCRQGPAPRRAENTRHAAGQRTGDR